uniref:Uncharacterized protein n=1 Tax=Micrurus carvalhoi TaxID=3147026 RepID=A0A2H6NHV7_9SAUR
MSMCLDLKPFVNSGILLRTRKLGCPNLLCHLWMHLSMNYWWDSGQDCLWLQAFILLVNVELLKNIFIFSILYIKIVFACLSIQTKFKSCFNVFHFFNFHVLGVTIYLGLIQVACRLKINE